MGISTADGRQFDTEFDFHAQDEPLPKPIEEEGTTKKEPLRFTIHPRKDNEDPLDYSEEKAAGRVKQSDEAGQPQQQMTHKSSDQQSEKVAGVINALGRHVAGIITGPITAAKDLTEQALQGKFVSDDPQNIEKAISAVSIAGTGAIKRNHGYNNEIKSASEKPKIIQNPQQQQQGEIFDLEAKRNQQYQQKLDAIKKKNLQELGQQGYFTTHELDNGWFIAYNPSDAGAKKAGTNFVLMSPQGGAALYGKSPEDLLIRGFPKNERPGFKSKAKQP